MTKNSKKNFCPKTKAFLSLIKIFNILRIMSDQKSVPMGLKFAFGGLSGAGAAFCVQPMDLVKNRMQVCDSYQ